MKYNIIHISEKDMEQMGDKMILDALLNQGNYNEMIGGGGMHEIKKKFMQIKRQENSR